MDLMEDVSFKAKYHKHKIRVKLWESDFMEKYGRKPNKNDIKSADMAIREAYKIYWKLKTRALDKSLTEITFCDETENIIFPSNNVSVSILQSRKNIHENKEKPVHSNTTVLQDSLPKSHSFNTEIASIGFDDKANIKEVWGQHLNIEQNTITKNEDGDRSSFQLSQKMFNPQSFSKRNPRKCSYTKISSKCKNELDICSSQLNEQNLIDKNSFDLSSILRTSLNEKLKIINEQQNRSSQATNTIQQFIKKCKITTCNKPLNESWLNRCFDGNTNNSITEAHKLYWNSVPRANSLECNVSLKETTLIQNLLHDDDKAFSDDEDYICNSDSEEERKNKRVRNFNKVVEDNDLQLLKRSCINNDDISGCEKAINYPVLQTSLTKINNMEFFKNVSKELDDKAIECAVNTYKFQESKNECKEGNDSSNKDDANRNKTEKLKYKESAGHAYKRKCDSFSNSIHIKRNYQKTAKETNFNNFNENKYQSKNNIVNEDKDNIENEVKQALYNIEFLDVVPRLPLNMTTSGNLITDFTRVLEPSSLQKESKFYTSFATQSSSKEKVEKKDPFGKFNENYVKINLKKKVFVRGKKSFNLSKYKRNKWKQRKKELNSSKSNLDFADFVDKNKELLCFKCGEIGHFAKKCTNIEGDNLLKLDEDTNTSSYPTLQEVDKIDNLKKQEANFQHKDAEIKKSLVSSNIEQLKEMESNEIKNLSDWEDYKGDSNMNKSNLTLNKVPDNLIARLLPSQTQKLCPVYQLQVDGSIKGSIFFKYN